MKRNVFPAYPGLKPLTLLLIMCFGLLKGFSQAPANDLCAGAITLTPALTCANVTGTMNNATITGGTLAACGGTARYDVWYKFVATAANPTITLSNVGANFFSPGIQVINFTSCVSMTSFICANGLTVTPVGLTIGTTYYVRIFSTVNILPVANANFDICITNPTPPANDLCSNAISLTSGATCTNVTGTIANATFTTGTTAACAGTVAYDVWYSFVAQRTNPTITLSTVGANFTTQGPKIQLFSGTCGSLTSVGCGTTTYAPTGLTVGATYFIRVYSTTGSPVPNTLGNFDICITDPAPPANDFCAGATTLVEGATCVTTAGTLLNATATAAVPGDCGAVGSPEVWYKFVATQTFPTITIGSVGAAFTAAGTRLQLLSGTCGSFTSLACVSGLVLTSGLYTGPGLSIGSTYYVRVYSNSAVMSGTTWGFNICVTDAPSAAPAVTTSRSYLNTTKGTSGGTIEPGDELEIRTTFTLNGGNVYNPMYTDNIPANTAYVPGTLRILTDEGLTYKQYTDAADGDPGTLTGSAVAINLGNTATQTSGAMIKAADRPNVYGTYAIIVSYHVTVTSAYGSTINFGSGSVSFANAAGTTTTNFFPNVNAVVYKNTGICTNNVGSNTILSESGGTFGSGNAKDRGAASSKVPGSYTYTALGPSAPLDNLYGITNNSSAGLAAANYSFNYNDAVSAHRVFGLWDIIGDHTGASDPLAGNPAPDVKSGAIGGYMVAINAAFKTDTAFLDTVINLCPSTSYEYSAWFRNMCQKCSADSTSKQPTTLGYVPTGPGDSSGVHPNLTFNINGFDYYTTGDMKYIGQWVKKGFTYRTGPAETQMIINIRNNAPGGGGNDWVIDDIGVATCSPTLDVTPSTPTLNICYGDGATLTAQIKSFFDNYTYWIWEKTVDSGATWVSAGAPYSGNGGFTPPLVGSEYVYTANGPSVIGDSTTHGNIFRLRVASSSGNLADSNCSFIALRTVQVYVNNCSNLLKTSFLSFSGALHNKLAVLDWRVTNEVENVKYEVEKSTDGTHFTNIGKVFGHAVNGNGSYQFTDPMIISGITYYRIKLVEPTGYNYTKTIVLSTLDLAFDIRSVISPFTGELVFDVLAPDAGQVQILISDNYGRIVKSTFANAGKGNTTIRVAGMYGLTPGVYALQVNYKGKMIAKRIMKQ